MPDIINFCPLKELRFQMRFIPDAFLLQQSQIQKKVFNIGPVDTVYYLLEYQRPNFSKAKQNLIFLQDILKECVGSSNHCSDLAFTI